MIELVIQQLLVISFYLFFVYYSFCDGFNLKFIRKIGWAIIFSWICFLSLQTTGNFDLMLILPIPSALAMFLCWQAKRSQLKK